MKSEGLEQSVVKLNKGRWKWSEDNPRPSWETVRKCELWNGDTWKPLRESLSRAVAVPNLQISDNQDYATIWLNPPGEDGTQGDGPHINVCKIAGSKAVPPKFAGCNPKLVCHVFIVRLND